MEQEVKLSNKTFMDLHEQVRKNKSSIRVLEEDSKEYRERISELEKEQELKEATLTYIIEKAINEALKPYADENTILKDQIKDLQIDKYKTAYNAWKWVSVSAGLVIVGFIMTSFINAIVN
ncbi:hypothetical protein HBP99_12125 [Listeria booriae]|uniref:Uncharacterized protein n=1 Tax=Listeria booriae TaxID=1552123 RepID=A0A841WAP0_9LIST|nr:hypothetical protein [Listeria booriae]MBC1230561.1 hypothetical protein [Listeria booriae]MBC1233618.1 hypothetical protein [Listeria booriae]MBC1316583.1 hypothetical protein [Listeria booriae]MBC1801065.1 hypothetical protein [Listeria booriae]MBC2369385.1 hypothetical protein [Listeria booriae]